MSDVPDRADDKMSDPPNPYLIDDAAPYNRVYDRKLAAKEANDYWDGWGQRNSRAC